MSNYSENDSRYRLFYSANRLTLQDQAMPATKSICVDFVSGRLGYRLVHGRNKHQPLAKAIGLSKRASPRVIDATAGMGRDAIMLMALGCRVLMLERSPIIAALLEDGLDRARQNPILGPLIRQRLQFIHTESISYLKRLARKDRPDVIYLDPMYPQRTKSALVKKEMQMLRELIGDDMDADSLLEVALQNAIWRVVVKRPIKAEPLHGFSPTTIIHGKTTRFDVYSDPSKIHYG